MASYVPREPVCLWKISNSLQFVFSMIIQWHILGMGLCQVSSFSQLNIFYKDNWQLCATYENAVILGKCKCKKQIIKKRTINMNSSCVFVLTNSGKFDFESYNKDSTHLQIPQIKQLQVSSSTLIFS